MAALPKPKANIIPLNTTKERVNRGGLKKRGKYYHYRFEVDGKEYTGSTKQEKLKDAKKELERQRQKIHHRAKGTPYNPKLSEVITEWEKTQKSLNHSEKHIANCSRLFEAHVYPVITDLTIEEVTDKHIEDIRLEYLKTHTEHGTNTLLTYVKSILRYAGKSYKIAIPEVEKIKAQEKEITFLDMDQIFTFLDSIDHKKMKAGHGASIPINVQMSFAVRVMLFHGWRENEVLGMEWENLNKEKKTYLLDKTKGKETGYIVLADEVMEWIPALEKIKNGPYLLHQTDGTPHKEGYTSNPVRRASKRMGMNFGPHTLRKTHACLLAALGTDDFTIQKTMRHKSIATTKVYVKVVNKAVTNAQNNLMNALRKTKEEMEEMQKEESESTEKIGS